VVVREHFPGHEGEPGFIRRREIVSAEAREEKAESKYRYGGKKNSLFFLNQVGFQKNGIPL
jgi:hypothetical protein